MSLRLLAKRRYESHPTQTSLERRVARTSTNELHLWLDTTLAGIGRLGKDARTASDTERPLLLHEAEEGAVAVQVVLRELQRR